VRVRKQRMRAELRQYLDRALQGVDGISEERRRALDDLAVFVSSKRRSGETAELTFICTHNSRRSHMGQLWAAAAAAHFHIDEVRTYSAGTEATAFNLRALAAMERAGFVIEKPRGDNPRYRVTFDESGPVIECFSKTYDDPLNPAEGFAAVMTCSEADAACPVVLGAALRVPIRYKDPKVADGTPQEAAVYDERCLQIATEMLYLFSRVASQS
jgi:arsenate reductase